MTIAIVRITISPSTWRICSHVFVKSHQPSGLGWFSEPYFPSSFNPLPYGRVYPSPYPLPGPSWSPFPRGLDSQEPLKTFSAHPKTIVTMVMWRFWKVRETTQTVLRGSKAPEDVATLPPYPFQAFQGHSRRSQDPRSHQQHLENACFTIVKQAFFIFMLNAFSTVQDASRPPQEVGKAPQGAPEGPQIGQARAQDPPKSAKKK